MPRAQAVVAAHERAVIRVAERSWLRALRRLRRGHSGFPRLHARPVLRSAARKFPGRCHSFSLLSLKMRFYFMQKMTAAVILGPDSKYFLLSALHPLSEKQNLVIIMVYSYTRVLLWGA